MYKDVGHDSKYLTDNRGVRNELVTTTEDCALICTLDPRCTMFYVHTVGTGTEAYMECVYEQ